MTARRRLSSSDKLHVLARQAICPVCLGTLGTLKCLAFDHEHALARGGADDIDNVRAIHRDPCHARKTAKQDIPEAAKTKRLVRKNEAAVARMLAKADGEQERQSRWGSRPFPKRRAR